MKLHFPVTLSSNTAVVPLDVTTHQALLAYRFRFCLRPPFIHRPFHNTTFPNRSTAKPLDIFGVPSLVYELQELESPVLQLTQVWDPSPIALDHNRVLSVHIPRMASNWIALDTNT